MRLITEDQITGPRELDVTVFLIHYVLKGTNSLRQIDPFPEISVFFSESERWNRPISGTRTKRPCKIAFGLSLQNSVFRKTLIRSIVTIEFLIRPRLQPFVL